MKLHLVYIIIITREQKILNLKSVVGIDLCNKK